MNSLEEKLLDLCEREVATHPFDDSSSSSDDCGEAIEHLLTFSDNSGSSKNKKDPFKTAASESTFSDKSGSSKNKKDPFKTAASELLQRKTLSKLQFPSFKTYFDKKKYLPYVLPERKVPDSQERFGFLEKLASEYKNTINQPYCNSSCSMFLNLILKYRLNIFIFSFNPNEYQILILKQTCYSYGELIPVGKCYYTEDSFLNAICREEVTHEMMVLVEQYKEIQLLYDGYLIVKVHTCLTEGKSSFHDFILLRPLKSPNLSQSKNVSEHNHYLKMKNARLQYENKSVRNDASNLRFLNTCGRNHLPFRMRKLNVEEYLRKPKVLNEPDQEISCRLHRDLRNDKLIRKILRKAASNVPNIRSIICSGFNSMLDLLKTNCSKKDELKDEMTAGHAFANASDSDMMRIEDKDASSIDDDDDDNYLKQNLEFFFDPASFNPVDTTKDPCNSDSEYDEIMSVEDAKQYIVAKLNKKNKNLHIPPIENGMFVSKDPPVFQIETPVDLSDQCYHRPTFHEDSSQFCLSKMCYHPHDSLNFTQFCPTEIENRYPDLRPPDSNSLKEMRHPPDKPPPDSNKSDDDDKAGVPEWQRLLKSSMIKKPNDYDEFTDSEMFKLCGIPETSYVAKSIDNNVPVDDKEFMNMFSSCDLNYVRMLVRGYLTYKEQHPDQSDSELDD